jgi:hypothetical protein
MPHNPLKVAQLFGRSHCSIFRIGKAEQDTIIKAGGKLLSVALSVDYMVLNQTT